MHTLPPDEDAAYLVRRDMGPVEVPPGDTPKQRRGFFRAIAVWLRLVKEDAAADAARLREAGLQNVELRNAEKAAEAARTVADAAKLHAETDVAQQERALAAERVTGARIDNEVKAAEAKAAIAEANSRRLRAIRVAAEELRATLTTLRLTSGELGFEREQLLQLLAQGLEEFPDDAVLQMLAEEAGFADESSADSRS